MCVSDVHDTFVRLQNCVLKKTCRALCFSPAKVFVFLPSEGGVGSQEVLSLYNPSKDQSVAYKVTYVTPRHNHLCSSCAMRQRVVNSVRPLLSYRVCVLHKRCAK